MDGIKEISIKNKISLLGCGWLGVSLAQYLLTLGYRPNGSTTSPAKVSLLNDLGITPFLINVAPQVQGADITPFFEADVLFLNIPFKRSLTDPSFYKKQIESVVFFVKDSSIKHVIFASSTSIYPDTLLDASEDSLFAPDNPRSKVLKEIEDLLLADKHFQTTILRFAGLYGPDRPIGNFLLADKERSKEILAYGNKRVNLIHREDCVAIITQIIEKGTIGNQVLNLCSDGHPTRQELYVIAAGKMGRPIPEFSTQGTYEGKIVNNQKLKQLLNYTFKYPDPLNAI